MKKPSSFPYSRRRNRRLNHAALAALFFGTFAVTQQTGNASVLQNPVNGGTTDPDSVFVVDGPSNTAGVLDSNTIAGLDFLAGSDLHIYNTLNLGGSGLHVEEGFAGISGGLLMAGDTSKTGNGSLTLDSSLTVIVTGDFNNTGGTTTLEGFMTVTGDLFNDGATFENRGDLYTDNVLVRDGTFTNFEYLSTDDIRVGQDGEFITRAFSETYAEDIRVFRGSIETGFRSILTAEDIRVNRGYIETGFRSTLNADDIDIRRGALETGAFSQTHVDDIDVSRGRVETGFGSTLTAGDIDLDRRSTFTTGRFSKSYVGDIDLDRGSSFTAGRFSDVFANDIELDRGSSFTTSLFSDLYAEDIDLDRGSSFTTGWFSEAYVDDIDLNRGSTFTTGAFSELYADDIELNRGSDFTTGYRSELRAEDIEVSRGSTFTIGTRSSARVDDIDVNRGSSFTTGERSDLRADDIEVSRGSSFTTGSRSDLRADDIEVDRGSSFTTGSRSDLRADDIEVSRGSSFTTGYRSDLRADDIEVDRGSSFTTGYRSDLRAYDIEVSRGSTFTTGSRSDLRAEDIEVSRGSTFTTGSRSDLRAEDIEVDRGSSFTTGYRSDLRADDIEVSRGSTFTTGSRSDLRAEDIEVDRGSSFTTGSRSDLRADDIEVSRGSSFATGYRSDLRAEDIEVSHGSSFTTGYRSSLEAEDIEIYRGSFETGERSRTTVEDIDIERGRFVNNGYLRADDINIEAGGRFFNDGYVRADDIDIDGGRFFNDGYVRADDIDIYRGGFVNDGYLRADNIEVSRGRILNNGYLAARSIEIFRGQVFNAEDAHLEVRRDIDIYGGAFTNNGYLETDDIDVRRGEFVTGVSSVTYADDIGIRRGTLVNDGFLNADDVRLRRGSSFFNGESAAAFLDDVYVSRSSSLSNAGSLYSDWVYSRGSVENTGTIYASFVGNEGGTFVNNGTIDTASFYNGSDSLLMGSGTITGNLYNAGVVSPGNSPGTVHVGGDYIQPSGGMLVVEIGSTSNYDELIVAGTAFLDGALAISGNITIGGQYRFLKAAAIVGEFADLLAPDGLRIRLLEKSTSITALLAPETYSQMATNPNHRSVARALDRFIDATSGDRQTVSLALDNLAADEYANAFQQISPALHETVGTQAVNLTQQQGRLLQQRIGTARYGIRGGYQSTTAAPALQTDRDGKSVYQSKAVKEVVTTVEEPNRWSTWIEGNGIFSRVTQAPQVPNGKTRAGGFIVGTDYAWNPNFITGLFAGYEGLETKYTDESRVTMNGARFGGYGTYTLDNGLYFDGVVWGGMSEYDMHRRIKFGSIDRTANSTQEAGELSAILGTGYDWKPGNFIVGPTASLQYTYVGIDGFEEDNAKSLNLDIERQRIHSLRSNLGARLAYRFQPNENVVLVPELRASWEYEFLNDARDINGSLSGKSISYRTEEGERNSLFAGAGINALFNNRVTTSVHYNVDLGRSNDTAHIISASFGVNW